MLSFKEQQAEEFITEEWNSAAIDVAADYFLDEGINEEGIDLIVEEVGLEDFIEYILDPPSEDLMEERSAKRATASAPSYEKVKAKVDSGDAARKKAGKGEYAKTAAAKRNYGDEDNTNYDEKKPAAKKKPVAKATTAPKPKAKPKVVEIKKKVEKSVPKAKAAQPAKKATKKGLLSKIGDTVKKGVERHQKAVSDTKAAYKSARAKGKVPEKRAKEFAKGVKSGVKTAVKFAKDVKKTVSEEAYDHYKDATLERRRVQSYKDSKPSHGATARKDDKEKSRKAFQNVVKNLKSRYGDDSVLTNKTNESVDLQEISADTLSAASRAADKDRGKKAVAGDREGAAKRVKQASKFYKAAGEKRKLEKEEFKALTPDKKDQIRNQAERRKKSADRAQNASDYKTSTKQDQQVRKMKSVLKNEEYEVTNADKKGNTPAYQAYKAGKKNAKTGKPLYKAADHMKEEQTIDDFILEFIDLDDDGIDTLSFEELEQVCIEALEELEGDLLNEALEAIDSISLLTEAPSKHSANPNVAVQAPQKAKPKPQVSRKEKVKAALKSAGSALKKGVKATARGVGKAAGHAANAAEKGASAVGKVAKEVGKGYSDTRKGRSDEGSSTTDAKAPDESRGGSNRPRLRDKIKSGIKKVVGKAARAVSRGSRNVARRLGEEKYDWRSKLEVKE